MANNIPTLFVLSGLPGSGKSSYAEKLKTKYNASIFSSDSIREELGDINDQSNNEKVFQILHDRIKASLNNSYNSIYDATNLTRKNRLKFLNEIENIPCKKVCVLMMSSWELCLAQNFTRDRQVPDDVMCRMYKSFQPPHYCEGWDEVKIVRHRIDLEAEYIQHFSFYTWYEKYKNLSHDNPHHKLSIGKHAKKALEYSLDNYRYDKIIQYAAAFHDMGKPDVKSFANSKGEISDVAHYYNHENISSYNVLLYDFGLTDDEMLDISLLISMHMRPFIWELSEKSKDKDYKLIGEELFNKLLALHECDIKAD